MSLEKAKNEAINIVKKAYITKPNELTLEEIILFIDGPQVVFEDLSGCEGKFISIANSSIIKINSNIKNEGRKRFTLAHELGHYILHRNMNYIKCTIEDFYDWTGRKQIETEANYFASELLMPTDIFFEQTKNKSFSVGFLKEIAQYFDTSFTSTAIKFVECGEDPVFLICSRDGVIQWKKANKNFRFFIDFKNLKKIPQESVTYEITHQLASYSDPQEVDPRYWLIKDEDHEFTFYEDMVNLEMYGYTLTFIFVK